MSNQVEFVSLDQLVADDHRYRHFKQILSESFVSKQVAGLTKLTGRTAYGINRLFYCLLLQFMEDLSDRECEQYLLENLGAKWFCGFTLTEPTPDHSVICRVRKRIGTKRLSDLFSSMRSALSDHGMMSEVFTFVDATHLISKANLWEETDRAIKAKYDKLNNDILPKVAHDKQARIGGKGKSKFWYGYKQHTSVDMQSGLINKIAITPANVTDAKGMVHVCPTQGALYADKCYCVKPVMQAAKINGVHLAAIKKNNMKGKNRDQDRWYSGISSPYERVFSRRNIRVRFKGVSKNQFAAFMTAISFNLKRIKVLDPPSFIFV